MLQLVGQRAKLKRIRRERRALVFVQDFGAAAPSSVPKRVRLRFGRGQLLEFYAIGPQNAAEAHKPALRVGLPRPQRDDADGHTGR
jgi:hypothetical protein